MSRANRKPHIMELPYEILMHIFKKLSANEKKQASETCYYWYTALNDHSFVKNKVLIYDNLSCCKDNLNPKQILPFSPNTICNYSLRINNMSCVSNDFWIMLGGSIRSLSICNCELSYEDIMVVLGTCQKLEKLCLISCKYIAPNHPSIITYFETTYTLQYLKCLDLSNSYISHGIFDIIVKNSPAIEKLNLSGCYIDYDLGIWNQHNNIQFLDFMFSNIMKFIYSRSKFVKHLIFSEINDATLNSLTNCENLYLESLELNSYCNITEGALLDFVKRQVFLKKLAFNCIVPCSNRVMLYICRYLTRLEYLHAENCIDLTEYGISELYKLKNLKSLALPSFRTSDGIVKGLCKERNHVLKELYLRSYSNVHESCFISMMTTFTSLKLLDVSYCDEAITDKSLQVIFKCQLQIEVLMLTCCTKIRHLGILHEEEAYSNNNINISTGLHSLKRLKEIDLFGCYNITSECIKHSFRLPNLVKLNLAKCSNLTHENLTYIVKNCPNIEELNVSYCENITNRTINLLGTSLKYLKVLDIWGCNISMRNIEGKFRQLKIVNSTQVFEYFDDFIGSC